MGLRVRETEHGILNIAPEVLGTIRDFYREVLDTIRDFYREVLSTIRDFYRDIIQLMINYVALAFAILLIATVLFMVVFFAKPEILVKALLG